MKRIPKGEKFMLFAVGMLVVIAILKSWPNLKKEDGLPAASDRSPHAVSLFSLNWLARVHIGIQSIILDNRPALRESGFTKQQIERFTSGNFAAQYLFPRTSEQRTPTPDEIDVVRARLIVAAHFGLKDQIEEQSRFLREILKNSIPERIDEVVLAYIDPSQNSALPPSPSEWEIIESKVGWIGKLLAYNLAKDKGGSRELLRETKSMAMRFISFLAFSSLCFIAGSIAVLIFFARFVRGRIHYKFEPSTIPTRLIILTFICYLAALNSSGAVLLLFTQIQSLPLRLLLQIGIFLVVGGIIFLPVLLGASLRGLISTVGLRVNSKREMFAEAMLGPIAYISFWPILILFLGLYSALLRSLGRNVVEGAHPVVPVVLSGEGGVAAFVLLMVLAVIVAPCLEELMFRGVFYSWLRSYLGRASSIFACGFVFAVIHPQGMLGILPLTLIGAGLAFLREWRGTIYAPIVAHACNNAMIFAFLLTMR